MEGEGRHNLKKPLGLAGLLLVMIVLPLALPPYQDTVLILFTINIILVVSFRLITTMGGWSFAHVVLMGVGAYTSALLTTELLHWSFWLTLPLGGLASALIAFVISFPCLRTKGFYFFISTFAAGEAIRQVWIRFKVPFGSFDGIGGIIHPNPIFGIDFIGLLPNYYLVLSITLLSVAIMYRLDKSRIGDTVKVIVLSEELSKSIGINTWGYKTMAFVVGSFFAGVTGVLFAHYVRFVSPMDFTGVYMFFVVICAIVGGTATFCGPIMGLVVVTLITEFLRDFLEWVPLFYGLFIIAILLFLPGGLESLLKKTSYLGKKMRMVSEER